MRKYILLLSLIFVVIIGCDNSTDPTLNNGSIKMYLVDAPSSLDSIIIFVKRVEVHRSDGGDNSRWYIINDSLRSFDLLELTNGASAVLGNSVLEPGKYSQIRLILDEGNYVIDQGVKHYLTVPSGMETGIKLNHQFTIESDNLYELYLDFNVDKSVHITGNGEYMLQPVIRVMPMIISGTISGQVLPIDAQATVFTTIGTDTVTTYPDENGFFKLMALPQGNYNVEIHPENILYKDTVVTGVNVFAEQNTDIGTVELESN
jgi:hypothetical protein